ncbi:hypothetical protein FKW77_001796 [Venturia effusa]|uniref:Cupin type-2 domain-containing protein n=1 Tax=Venturia effusa TaxID=50376 RepID=A0A517LJQ1_9PEZI|nr:hypothetical protein FKW77_001796 [Venturia effusa]
MTDPSNPNLTKNPTSLPPNRRYICTHDSTGKSIFHSSPSQLYHGRQGVGGMARSYALSSVPAILQDDEDVKKYLDPDVESNPVSFRASDIVIPNTEQTPNGANLVVVDIAPGGESQMHRTVSVDFSICVVGSIGMELDGGEKVVLAPGDHVVQRGTMHKWFNASQTEPARFVAVTLPCEPFAIGGKRLAEEHVQGTGAKQKDGSRL